MDYVKVIDNLSIVVIAHAINLIKKSEELDVSDLCHIIIKETNEKIGYIGNHSIEFCNYPDQSYKKFHNYIVDNVLPSVDYINGNGL